MILSDRSLREQIAAGRIVIEPFDDKCVQPSSIDVKIGNLFRVFRNHTSAVIDVKQNQEDLTELITIADGDAFMLHPGEFVLGSTLERIVVPDDLVSRIEGKALATETEIPTPNGMTTMGQLRAGDWVFSDLGQPIQIRAVSEVMYTRPCRELTFSDGTMVIADAGHQWVTTTKDDRRVGRPPSVRTTDEIAATLKYRHEYNHQVHLSGSAKYPERVLPVAPYTFGIWLGDGTSTKAEVTTADPEVLEQIAADGYAVRPATGPMAYRIGGTHRTRNSAVRSFPSRLLAQLGAALDGVSSGNKHVPREYMESSLPQRFALLQGLMDSDGCIDKFGRAEFCSTKEHLATAVQELVASFGMTCTLNKDRAMLNGIDCGPRYRVRFTPDRPVFRLTRKLERLKLTNRTMLARSIRQIREIPSVPVRCIEVDERGIFLATRSFIPTHNSSLGRLGLIIHSTAGFIDAGFDGHVTLELTNIATLPITLYPGMKIGQVSFMQMTTPADNPYGKGARGSKYQGQRGPTPSRYWENFEA